MPRNVQAWMVMNTERADDLSIGYGLLVAKELLNQFAVLDIALRGAMASWPDTTRARWRRLGGGLDQLEAWAKQVKLGNVSREPYRG